MTPKIKHPSKKTICLYGAANEKIKDIYKQECYKLGFEIGKRDYHLIFGGGSLGIMGATAKGVTDAGGTVCAILPTWMDKFQKIFDKCETTIQTKTMDKRKFLFKENSDAIIVAPGGVGTLDEFFDIITGKKLEQYSQPIILFNIDHFYDNLLIFINKLYEENFIKKTDDKLFEVANSIEEIFEVIESKDI